ncbi:MAG: AraC family transcriptional regulator [Cyanobacteria bacterium J06632_22]
MRIEISYSEYPSFLDDCREKGWFSSYVKNDALLSDWHAPFLRGTNAFFKLRPSLQIHNWRQTFLESFDLVDGGSDAMPVIFVFLLTGHLQATYRDLTYRHALQLGAGQTLLLYSGLGKRGVWHCPYGLDSQTVEVVVSVQQLIHYLGENITSALMPLRQRLTQNREEPYFHSGAITPQMQMVLHQYLHCPYEGTMQRLYLESKAMELIALKLGQIQTMAEAVAPESVNGAGARPLSGQDTARIHRARQILLENMANPPSLQQLAEQVGIGDYKLKQDFRRTFGTTVFGYLRSHRLEQARQLLIDRRMSVSEVARFVGYSSLSKFSAAFKRQFGVVPSTYLGKKIDRS